VSLFGLFIIGRSSEPLDRVPSIQRLCTESRHEGIGPAIVVGRRADGPWQQVQTLGGDELDLVQLVTETSAPAMSIYVVESEFGCIDARTPAGPAWSGYLNPDTAVRAFGMPDPPAYIDSIADQAVAWAAQAGRTAVQAEVAAALCERVGPFGEGVDSLMRALGFRFGDQLVSG
jgi:hypothetical protein